jgi:hypothetical protein
MGRFWVIDGTQGSLRRERFILGSGEEMMWKEGR